MPSCLRLFQTVIVIALFVGCGASSSATEGAGTSCEAGQSRRCQCDLKLGTQTCAEDLKFGACTCDSQPSAPTNTGGPVVTPTPGNPTPPKSPGTTVVPDNCGNGRIDEGEACDDGNRRDGDGCSSTCHPDGAPATAETCSPGQPVAVNKAMVTLVGSTRTYAADIGVNGATGPDRVYAVTAARAGALSVTLQQTNYTAVVYVSQFGSCSPDETPSWMLTTAGESNSVPVYAGEVVKLIVAGVNSSDSGEYSVQVGIK